MSGSEQDLPYRVEVWDDGDTRVEELVALIGDHAVARVAFAETVKRRPGRIVTAEDAAASRQQRIGTAMEV